MGGQDDWTIGQFFYWVAPSFYITNEASNAYAAAVLGVLPIVILFLFLQKYFIQGMVDSAIK